MEKMSSKINLLLIDKDTSLLNLLNESSLSSQYNIYFVDSPNDIFPQIQNNDIEVVITHTDHPTTEAVSLMNEIKSFDPLLEFIIIGKPLSSEKVVDLISLGAIDYISRPVHPEAIEKVLKKIIEKKALRRETYLLEKKLEKKYFFEGIVGKSPYMLEIFSLIEKVAKYFSSILVTGETGTGKEIVARAIHSLGQTKNKELVVCDCVSIPENLFESELFGYVKGAFTGADRDKNGLFEEAHEGVIFLDEIGEIPLSVQAKLLRVLEYHQFRPLGSNKPKKVDVKVIAATSKNLREEIKRGAFRDDLFHRLSKVEIHLPPLRERTEDLPLLVRYFLSRYNKRFSKHIKGVSRQVQKLFHRYGWPGNIRELENSLERAVIISKKEFIDITDLPEYLQEYSSEKSSIPFLRPENLTTLDALEKEYIAFLLMKTENNVKRTAAILNISRTTLYSKLRKYNIPH